MTESSVWLPKGETGDKGPTGDPGPQGPEGPQGPAGPGLDAFLDDFENTTDPLKGIALGGRQELRINTVAELRTVAGRFDRDLCFLLNYLTGDEKGRGYLRWDAASTTPDDGVMCFAVTGVPTGRWKRNKQEVRADFAGLPLTSGFCMTQFQAIEAYCFANKVGAYFGEGVFDIGANNWPFRNPDVPALTLRDYGGICIRTAGAQTVFKTTSASGADFMQLNGVKGLRVSGFPTITATLTGTAGSGSNGVSITYGGEDIDLEVNCTDLPFVDKGTFGDGGKAWSIQPASGNTNPIKNIKIKGKATRCLYGFGVDVTYDAMVTNPAAGITIDVVTEDCFRSVSLSAAAPTVSPSRSPMFDIKGRVASINCQQTLIASRFVTSDLKISALNTKTAANLRGYLANFTDVLVADLKASKNCTFELRGSVLDVDKLLSAGGATMGGGVFGNCDGLKLLFDVGFTGATTQVEVVNAGGNRVSNSNIELLRVTSGFADLQNFGGNTVLLNGQPTTPTQYPGDNSASLAASPLAVAIYTVALTATRTVTFSATAKAGDRTKVSRLASATGSTLSINGLVNLVAGNWVECTYSGSAWQVTSSGTI